MYLGGTILTSEPTVEKEYTGLPVKHSRVFLVPFHVTCPINATLQTSHSLQGTRNTRPCLTGHAVIL